MPKLRDERAFPAWIYRIVTRGAGKRIGRIIAERHAVETLAYDNMDCSTQHIRNEPGLGKALAALSPVQRAALALHYFEDLSIAEVAVALDVPAGTIKTRLMHARNRLRAHFEGDEYGTDQ